MGGVDVSRLPAVARLTFQQADLFGRLAEAAAADPDKKASSGPEDERGFKEGLAGLHPEYTADQLQAAWESYQANLAAGG